MTVSAQNEELASLREQVESLTVALAAKTKVRSGPRDPVEGSKAVKAAHGKAKTYRALENGIDHKQGFIPAGAVFTTTQPKGSWMEPVKATKPEPEDEAEDTEEGGGDDA